MWAEREGWWGRRGENGYHTLPSTNRMSCYSCPAQWALSFTGCSGRYNLDLSQHVLCGGASLRQDKMSQTRYLIFSIINITVTKDGKPNEFSWKPLGPKLTTRLRVSCVAVSNYPFKCCIWHWTVNIQYNNVGFNWTLSVLYYNWPFTKNYLINSCWLFAWYLSYFSVYSGLTNLSYKLYTMNEGQICWY